MKAPNSALAIVVSLQVHSSWQALPLGAGCIVSALRADSSLSGRCEAVLLDLSLERDDFAAADTDARARLVIDRIRSLSSGRPLFVAFSVYVWNRTVFERSAAILRHEVPDAVICAGGPEITALDASSPTAFEYLVRGEGESATRALLRSWLDGTLVKPLKNSGIRSPAEHLAELPSPWLDGTLDKTDAVLLHRGALWELSRGCPYSCSYCYESKGDKKVRTYPLERLVMELEYFVKKGIERVFVLDPTYNANKKRALEILKLIKQRAPNIHFNFEVRSELLDRELVAAFSDIPCSLQIGLQSSNPQALVAVGRPSDLKQFSKKIALLNEAGVVFGLDVMYGLPCDTLATFRDSLDYALSLYPNNLELFRLSVLPGTTLYEDAARLSLVFNPEPPYQVVSLPGFSAEDLARAEALSRACDIFYTQGRAVTWFLSALAPLKQRPSRFLTDFDRFLQERKMFAGEGVVITHQEAEGLQLAFLDQAYHQKKLAHLLPALHDIVRFNGALTRALAEGEESTLDLSYHGEDLLGPESMDVVWFTDNACMEHCTVRVFPTADGPDFEIL